MRFWVADDSTVRCPPRTHSHGKGGKGEARRERIGGRRASERESRAPPSRFLLALSSPLSKVGIGYDVPFRCDPWTDRGEGTRVSSVSLILVRVAEGRSYPSHSEVSEAASIHAARECSYGGSPDRVGTRRDRLEAVVRPRASVGGGACDEFIFCGVPESAAAFVSLRTIFVGSTAWRRCRSKGKTGASPRADVYVVRARGRASESERIGPRRA